MTTSRRRFLSQTTSASAALAIANLSAADNTAPKQDRIQVGQIGTKHSHASGKMATMRDLSDLYQVVGIAEADKEQQDKVRDRGAYKDLQWLPEEALLADPNIKAIAVETDIPDLVPTAIRCLKAGKHIHLDKPAGESMAACRAMHAEATKRGLTIQMGYMLRYNPAFEFLFKAVKDGWLGKITEVHGRMGKLASPGLRDQLAKYPGGGMFELTCHLIDAVVTLLGKPQSVTATNHQSQPNRDQFVDNQLAVLNYPNAIATVGSNHIDRFGSARRQLEVVGTEGVIEIRPLEPPKLRLALSKPRGDYNKGYQDVDLPKSRGRYHGEFIDLAKVIRGEKKLAWDAQHDIQTHDAILRASGLSVES